MSAILCLKEATMQEHFRIAEPYIYKLKILGKLLLIRNVETPVRLYDPLAGYIKIVFNQL